MHISLYFGVLLFGGVRGDFNLNSPVVTNFGTWSLWDYCPSGTFVKSMGLKYFPVGENRPPPDSDDPDTIDDHGVVAIGLECSSPSDPRNVSGVVIKTGEGVFSTPLDTACDGFAIGFQLMSDQPQIALDNTGANNMRIYCSGLRESSIQYIEGYGEYVGEWTDTQYCKTRQALCGIQGQIEIGAADKTGINNVRVKCCDIPSPASTCKPTERWELVQECDNLKGMNPVQCTFYRTVGLSMGMNLDPDASPNGVSLLEEYYRYEALGFGVDSTNGDSHFWLMHDLSVNFAKTLGDSVETGQNWTIIGSETFKIETSTVIHMDVREGRRAEIYQLVGSCSYFSVRTPRLKKVDLDKFNNPPGSQVD